MVHPDITTIPLSHVSSTSNIIFFVIYFYAHKRNLIHGYGSRKKIPFLMAGPVRGGGVKEKLPFWNLFLQRSKISTAIKLEGG